MQAVRLTGSSQTSQFSRFMSREMMGRAVGRGRASLGDVGATTERHEHPPLACQFPPPTRPPARLGGGRPASGTQASPSPCLMAYISSWCGRGRGAGGTRSSRDTPSPPQTACRPAVPRHPAVRAGWWPESGFSAVVGREVDVHQPFDPGHQGRHLLSAEVVALPVHQHAAVWLKRWKCESSKPPTSGLSVPSCAVRASSSQSRAGA